jgi:hypothetical protein
LNKDLKRKRNFQGVLQKSSELLFAQTEGSQPLLKHRIKKYPSTETGSLGSIESD